MQSYLIKGKDVDSAAKPNSGKEKLFSQSIKITPDSSDILLWFKYGQ